MDPMREEIILALVLNNTQDLFQMLQLKSTVVYSNSTCLQKYQKPKKPLFLVPKKVLKQK